MKRQGDVRITTCEHCLMPYGWKSEAGYSAGRRGLESDVAPPCPRCGYIQSDYQASLRARSRRVLSLWLGLLVAVVIAFTTAMVVLSYAFEWRPVFAMSFGGAALFLSLGAWGGCYRFATKSDPNRNLEKRKERARLAGENPSIWGYENLTKIPDFDGDDLPAPPEWSWKEAERLYASEAQRQSLRYELFRGLAIGAVPALLCLFGGRFYLDWTRSEWELDQLFSPQRTARQRAVRYLWLEGDEKDRESLVRWFSTRRMDSKEADFYLLYLENMPLKHKRNIIDSILFYQTGSPGPAAWRILEDQPVLVAQRITARLEAQAEAGGSISWFGGDADQEIWKRLFMIFIRVHPEEFYRLFERRIEAKPGLIRSLAEHPDLMRGKWRPLARAVLSSASQDPRLTLDLVETFLRVAPRSEVNGVLKDVIGKIDPWMVQPVANNPFEYLQVALYSPRTEWVGAIVEAVSSATADFDSLVREAGDALKDIVSATASELVRTDQGGIENRGYLRLRMLAHQNPKEARKIVRERLEGFLQSAWGTLTPETLEVQALAKDRLKQLARVLIGIELDRQWVRDLALGLQIRDPELRGEWVKLLSTAAGEELILGYSLSWETGRKLPDWEIDSFIESLRESQGITPLEVAELLTSQLNPNEGEVKQDIPGPIRFALLEYLSEEGDRKVMGHLRRLVEDDSIVYRMGDWRRGRPSQESSSASRPIRVGDYAAEVVRKLEN